MNSYVLGTPLRIFRDKMIDQMNQKKPYIRPIMTHYEGCDCKEFLQNIIQKEGEHRVVVWIKGRLRKIENDRIRKQKHG